MLFGNGEQKRKVFKKSVLFLLVMLLAFCGAAIPAAAEVIDEDIIKSIGDLEIYKDTTVNGDVQVNIGSMKVRGTVNGDVGADMGEVDISGSVTGNVKADMGKVTVNGVVIGNVNADMGEIIINGDVDGNVKGGMGKINIAGNVSGDVESSLGEIVISGIVGGNVGSEESKITVNGTVDGNINLHFGTVELGPNALVNGIIVVDEGRVVASDGANYNEINIKKELTADEIDNFIFFPRGFSFHGIDNITDFFRDGEFFRNIRGFEFRDIPSIFRFNFFGINNWRTGQKTVSILIMFALAVLVFTLFPRPVENVRYTFEQKTGQVVLWGILAVILALPLMVLLIITIIGIPLIVVEVLAFAVAWLLGYTGIVYLIGQRVLETAKSSAHNPFLKILVGVAIIGLIGLVPWAGSLVGFAVFVLAVGSSLVSGFGTKGQAEEYQEVARAYAPLQPNQGHEDEGNISDKGSGENNNNHR